MEARFLKNVEQRVEMGLIGFGLMTARSIPENLLDHAAPAGRVVRQNSAELLDGGELRIRNTLNVRRRVQRKLKVLGLPRLVGDRVALQLNFDLQLLAVAPQVVELLEAEADGIDQGVARRAARVAEVNLQALVKDFRAPKQR